MFPPSFSDNESIYQNASLMLDVVSGEELFISCVPLLRNATQRQEAPQHWRFGCDCWGCSPTQGQGAEQQIADLARSIQQHWRDPDVSREDETMSDIVRLIEILSEA
jgi:hypothetical protein